MCIICVSKKGINQPSEDIIRTMFSRNSHGAGYMVARDGGVIIHKGFMNVEEFLNAIRRENFTKDDAVIYHFRISTQGGVNPEMCHPFGLSRNLSDMKALDLVARVGIAHNGIIALTSNAKDKEYSDTAHFIAEYLPHLIRNVKDIKNPKIIEIIEELAGSKLAFMDGNGYIALAGDFIREKDGLLYSNSTYKPIPTTYTYDKATRRYRFNLNDEYTCDDDYVSIWK